MQSTFCKHSFALTQANDKLTCITQYFNTSILIILASKFANNFVSSTYGFKFVAFQIRFHFELKFKCFKIWKIFLLNSCWFDTIKPLQPGRINDYAELMKSNKYQFLVPEPTIIKNSIKLNEQTYLEYRYLNLTHESHFKVVNGLPNAMELLKNNYTHFVILQSEHNGFFPIELPPIKRRVFAKKHSTRIGLSFCTRTKDALKPWSPWYIRLKLAEQAKEIVDKLHAAGIWMFWRTVDHAGGHFIYHIIRAVTEAEKKYSLFEENFAPLRMDGPLKLIFYVYLVLISCCVVAYCGEHWRNEREFCVSRFKVLRQKGSRVFNEIIVRSLQHFYWRFHYRHIQPLRRYLVWMRIVLDSLQARIACVCNCNLCVPSSYVWQYHQLLFINHYPN